MASLRPRTLVVALLLLAGPAAAQNLEWAEPQTSSGSEEATIALDAQAAPPGPPDNPKKVPVDGGLLLLGAAGVSYAVLRLRQRHAQV